MKKIIMTLITIIVLLPIIFMISNSFMSAKEADSRYTELVTPYNSYSSVDGQHYAELTLIPTYVTLDGYKKVLTDDQAYLRMFWNSVLITIPIMIGQLLISPMAAYAFEMSTWKYKEVLYLIYIIVMLMPMQLLMVPHYITADFLGYNHTWWAIILPAIFAPFGTFLLRQQLSGFDKTLVEAARVEGASEWRVFFKVVLPNMKATMAALAALTFVDCWNIVDQAVVFIIDVFKEPLSVYLSKIVQGNPGLVFSSACIFMVPAILVFLLSHEYMVHGISLSSGREV